MFDGRLVEVDTTPDLDKYKPIVILKIQEFAKLVKNLHDMKEPWIAMKFNDSIFLVWREMVFLHMLSRQKKFDIQRRAKRVE